MARSTSVSSSAPMKGLKNGTGADSVKMTPVDRERPFQLHHGTRSSVVILLAHGEPHPLVQPERRIVAKISSDDDTSGSQSCRHLAELGHQYPPHAEPARIGNDSEGGQLRWDICVR